jgi:hypothetical protein
LSSHLCSCLPNVLFCETLQPNKYQYFSFCKCVSMCAVKFDSVGGRGNL